MKKDDSEQPWQHLKSARQAKKLRQKDLAEACGVSRSAVSLWERSLEDGGNPPSLENANVLSQLLGIPIDSIYGASMVTSKHDEEFNVTAINQIVALLDQHRGKKRRAPYGTSSNKLVQKLHEYFQTHVPLVPWSQLPEYANHNRRKHIAAHADMVPCPVKWTKDMVAVRVIDDSMTSTATKSYPKGSTVFVDLSRSRDAIPNSRVLAATLTTKGNPKPAVCFREYAEDDDGAYLRALNHKYKSIRASFDVVGVVVGKFEHD